jgi:predicted protein tyrosine phosphatase
MPYNKVEFVSASAVSRIAGRADTIVISIRSSGTTPAHIKSGFKDVLYLEFDNIQFPKEGSIVFSEAHAEQILAFVDKHEASASRILVNCGAGESRSAAVAFYLAQIKYELPLEGELGYMLHRVADVLYWVDEERQPAKAA